MTYAVVTLGCKLNQADSADVAGRLGGAAGAAPAETADLIVLNTCTVTHKADREAHRLARALKRANPRATLAVMGCGARREARAFEAMPEVDAVLGDEGALDAFLRAHAAVAGDPPANDLPCFGGRTRAFLKIQEGCDFPCTYCIVPSVRGPSRSVPEDRVEEAFRSLVGAGYREIVLTGVNTGEYGRDLGVSEGLPRLLERLLALDGPFRVRLNSVEPRAVTPGLISLLKGEPRLCRHLQIPLQSGSDRVLAAMRRNYRSSFYEDLVTRLAQEVPGIGLGADILAGFPAETPADFEATFDLVARLPLAFLHAFSFSPRPGTPAAALSPVPHGEVAQRTARLRALGSRKSDAFAQSLDGEEVEALTLAPAGNRGRALTDNYLSVALSDAVPANRFVRIRLEAGEGAPVTGVLQEPP